MNFFLYMIGTCVKFVCENSYSNVLGLVVLTQKFLLLKKQNIKIHPNLNAECENEVKW